MEQLYTDGFEALFNSKDGIKLSKKIKIIQIKSRISNSNLKTLKPGDIIEIQFTFLGGQARHPEVSFLDESGKLLLKGKTVHMSAHMAKIIYEEI